MHTLETSSIGDDSQHKLSPERTGREKQLSGHSIKLKGRL